jgi:hypothetical protein
MPAQLLNETRSTLSGGRTSATTANDKAFVRYDLERIDRSKTAPDYTINQRFIRNGNEYGGYYTQNEQKNFIDYATVRGIEHPRSRHAGVLHRSHESLP